MNIFVVHSNPTICARTLDNVRLNKMIVETGQIISTVLRTKYNDKTKKLYKAAYLNHPCIKWAQENPQHLVWLIHLFFEYTKEYTFRFHKVHLTEKTLNKHLRNILKNLPPFTTQIKFYNGSFYKKLPVFKAYRLTLKEKWKQDTLKGRPPHFN